MDDVPHRFGLSYTVPISKVKDFRFKAMTCDDIRDIAIAINSILSKVFLALHSRWISFNLFFIY